VTIDGIGLVIGFIDHSQFVTTSKYKTVAHSHIENHSLAGLLTRNNNSTTGRGIHANYINIPRPTYIHTHTDTHAAAQVIQRKKVYRIVLR
jgi:hypothetical protein